MASLKKLLERSDMTITLRSIICSNMVEKGGKSMVTQFDLVKAEWFYRCESSVPAHVVQGVSSAILHDGQVHVSLAHTLQRGRYRMPAV